MSPIAKLSCPCTSRRPWSVPCSSKDRLASAKTEVAKVVARAFDTELIRLQCYEGLDAHAALYEWNYQRQLLHIKLDEKSQRPLAEREADLFSEDFLLKRPLLQAITQPVPSSAADRRARPGRRGV